MIPLQPPARCRGFSITAERTGQRVDKASLLADVALFTGWPARWLRAASRLASRRLTHFGSDGPASSVGGLAPCSDLLRRLGYVANRLAHPSGSGRNDCRRWAFGPQANLHAGDLDWPASIQNLRPILHKPLSVKCCTVEWTVYRLPREDQLTVGHIGTTVFVKCHYRWYPYLRGDFPINVHYGIEFRPG